jgi:hypothetical protein
MMPKRFSMYFYATDEYGDILPETIRSSEQDSIKALCELRGCTEEKAFNDGICLAKVIGINNLFFVHGSITYIKGFRKDKHEH